MLTDDYQFSRSFYLNGIMPSMIVVTPVGESRHWHIVQEIEKSVCVWAVFGCYGEVMLSSNALRMTFLHSVQEC